MYYEIFRQTDEFFRYIDEDFRGIDISLLDRELRITGANLRFKDKFGDDLLGMPCYCVCKKCEDKQMIFEVANNGIGMDQEAVEKVFSFFISSKGTSGAIGITRPPGIAPTPCLQAHPRMRLLRLECLTKGCAAFPSGFQQAGQNL